MNYTKLFIQRQKIKGLLLLSYNYYNTYIENQSTQNFLFNHTREDKRPLTTEYCVRFINIVYRFLNAEITLIEVNLIYN